MVWGDNSNWGVSDRLRAYCKSPRAGGSAPPPFGETLPDAIRAETGLAPGRWRRQRKLMSSLELIASGEQVKTAAVAAGFKRNTHPKQHLGRRLAAQGGA